MHPRSMESAVPPDRASTRTPHRQDSGGSKDDPSEDQKHAARRGRHRKKPVARKSAHRNITGKQRAACSKARHGNKSNQSAQKSLVGQGSGTKHSDSMEQQEIGGAIEPRPRRPVRGCGGERDASGAHQAGKDEEYRHRGDRFLCNAICVAQSEAARWPRAIPECRRRYVRRCQAFQGTRRDADRDPPRWRRDGQQAPPVSPRRPW